MFDLSDGPLLLWLSRSSGISSLVGNEFKADRSVRRDNPNSRVNRLWRDYLKGGGCLYRAPWMNGIDGCAACCIPHKGWSHPGRLSYFNITAQGELDIVVTTLCASRRFGLLFAVKEFLQLDE